VSLTTRKNNAWPCPVGHAERCKRFISQKDHTKRRCPLIFGHLRRHLLKQRWRQSRHLQVDVQVGEAVGMGRDWHRLCGNYIRFLFAFNHVVSDAEWVAEVERISVFAEDDAAVIQ
jgi:hypothetical protein